MMMTQIQVDSIDYFSSFGGWLQGSKLRKGVLFAVEWDWGENNSKEEVKEEEGISRKKFPEVRPM